MPDLRALIREVLAEELAALRLGDEPTGPLTQTVALQNDSDLMAFVADLLQRATDPQFLRDVSSGQLQFSLGETAGCQPLAPRTALVHAPVASHPSAPYTLVASTPAFPLEMRKPIITERDVAALPRDQQRLRIDKKSRLTPLAADELRSRGIKVERISS